MNASNVNEFFFFINTYRYKGPSRKIQLYILTRFCAWCDEIKGLGAPPKHRVLEHQQQKHQLLLHRLSKTSIDDNIEYKTSTTIKNF